MLNKLINVVIALVEDRPEDARGMIRSPEMKDTSISELKVRLYASLDKNRDEAAREALRDVLRLTAKLGTGIESGEKFPTDPYEAYVHGITIVEELVDVLIRQRTPA